MVSRTGIPHQSVPFDPSRLFFGCVGASQTIRVVLESTVDTKSVTCMFAYPGGFVSGHKDGTIKLWTNSYECKNTFDLATATPASMNTSVRSVCVNSDASVVLIGTQGCEIYELALASKRFTLRAEGHFQDEVGGVR